jgi:hypothetical protein
MKFLLFFIILLPFWSCKNSKITTEKENISSDMVYNIPACPDEGNCSIEVLQHRSLSIKTDHTGKTYPEIQKGDNIVIKYQYKRNPLENTADSNYSEIIYFELSNKKLNLNLQDENLQQVKLLYGRLCFCRGATGYFKVKRGNLNIQFPDDKHLKILLNFKMKKIPQIIDQIDETIDLN